MKTWLRVAGLQGVLAITSSVSSVQQVYQGRASCEKQQLFWQRTLT